MDSAAFASSSKEEQVLEFAISGLYGDLLAKQYGDDLVKEVSQARDAIRDLIAKSVESREQAVHLSKRWFGDKALTVMTTFQQRLAEANKVPKKSKAKRAPKAVKEAADDSKVVKLEAGESTVVELVTADSKVEAKVTTEESSKTDANVKVDAKVKKSSKAPESPLAAVVAVVAPAPDAKKMKSAAVSGKKRKLGGESESEAS